MSGSLILVPTPIGNLGDISPRAAEALRTADFIAAEDTRVSVKLLNHLDIKKQLVSYHENNKLKSGPQILSRLLSGETCALVTDAGTPARTWCGSVRIMASRSLPSPAPVPPSLPWPSPVFPQAALPLRDFCPSTNGPAGSIWTGSGTSTAP